MKLYKYIGHQDDNELLNIIKNIFKDNTLKVTNPKDFNDPFDCNMPYLDENLSLKNIFKNEIKRTQKISSKQYHVRMEQQEGFNQQILAFEQEIKKEFEIFSSDWDIEISKFRILSLTIKKDDILMWSHYANFHSGVVLGFDNLKDIFDNLKPVKYVYERESKNFIVNNFIKKAIRVKNNKENEDKEINNFVDKIIEFLYIKKEEWKYEDEYRAIFFNDDKRIKKLRGIEIINFNKELVSEIIFGLNMTKENKIKICNFIKDYEYKINILEVIKKNGKLEIKEVEF
jgi:hypothetical protein